MEMPLSIPSQFMWSLSRIRNFSSGQQKLVSRASLIGDASRHVGHSRQFAIWASTRTRSTRQEPKFAFENHGFLTKRISKSLGHFLPVTKGQLDRSRHRQEISRGVVFVRVLFQKVADQYSQQATFAKCAFNAILNAQCAGRALDGQVGNWARLASRIVLPTP